MLGGSVDSEEVLKGLISAAEYFRMDMRSRIKDKSGNLRRGIVVKPFDKQKEGNPACFVAINYGIAPHAHLVEFGHGGKHPAPPHPFFRPAFDAMGKIAESKIKNTLRKEIEKIPEKPVPGEGE